METERRPILRWRAEGDVELLRVLRLLFARAAADWPDCLAAAGGGAGESIALRALIGRRRLARSRFFSSLGERARAGAKSFVVDRDLGDGVFLARGGFARAHRRARGRGGSEAMKKRQDNPSARRIIKKYSNRRLYDTRQSAYVTLENLHELILQGEDFQVVNAGDGADITAQSLAQVLVSEEIWGEPLFSERSLRNLIMFCGGPMRGPFLAFMEQCMAVFRKHAAAVFVAIGRRRANARAGDGASGGYARAHRPPSDGKLRLANVGRVFENAKRDRIRRAPRLGFRQLRRLFFAAAQITANL